MKCEKSVCVCGHVMVLVCHPLQCHVQRLHRRGCFSQEEMVGALREAEVCRAINRDRPGFFDAVVNCGKGGGEERGGGRRGSCTINYGTGFVSHLIAYIVITAALAIWLHNLSLCNVLVFTTTNQYKLFCQILIWSLISHLIDPVPHGDPFTFSHRLP